MFFNKKTSITQGSEDRDVLERFLSKPLDRSDGVFDEFRMLPNAIYKDYGELTKFVYIRGKREDRVLLIAHADTFWDKGCGEELAPESEPYIYENGIYRSTSPYHGIGADDRAGCAMLYLLRNSGHSLLITDGEECGQLAAEKIKNAEPQLYEELNSHSYMIELDRRGSCDYKFYRIPVSEDFEKFIANSTGYLNAGSASCTDIVKLADKICAVNLSIGYRHEHSESEILVFDDWQNTLDTVRAMLEKEQRKYPLKKG